VPHLDSFGRAAGVLSVAVLVVSLLASCTDGGAPAERSSERSCDPADRSQWAIAYTRVEDTYVQGVFWLVDGEHLPLYDDSEAQADTPALSPDGSQVLFDAFTLDTETGVTSDETWIMNTDGSDRRLFEQDTEGAAWSPDGSQIAYFDGGATIKLIDADGTNVVDVGHDAAGVPVWSPDGERIAWESATGISWESVDGDDSGRVDIADTGFVDAYSAVWLPDGRGFAAAMTPEAGETALYRLDLSGDTEPELLATNAWQPFPLPDGTIGAREDSESDDDSDPNHYVTIDPDTGERQDLAELPGTDPSVIACYR
jgi:hypothetical protein